MSGPWEKYASEEPGPWSKYDAKKKAPPKDDSAARGLAAGILKPFDNAARFLATVPVFKQIDEIGGAIGLPTAAGQADVNDAARKNNTRTGYQTLGNIVGTLPLARLPGGLLGQGAASGALLTDARDVGGVAKDAAIGAATSYVGGKALKALGSVATGIKNKGAKLLNDSGIPLTLGQIGRATGTKLGNFAGDIEDWAAGTPIISAFVNGARDNGIRALNTTLGNRILANVGDKVPKGVAPGHDMLEAIQGKLSSRYQALVPSLRGVMDKDFASDLAKAKSIVATLPASRQRQLASVVDDVFRNRTNGGVISGQALKDAESQLTKIYSKYKNAQGDEGIFGDAVDQVRQSLRNLVVRSNPQHGQELQGLNTAWAQLGSLKSAVRGGSDVTKASGIVTPGAALRVQSRKGYRDKLLETATDILPKRVPDSGTAGRLATAALLGGAVSVDPREHPVLAGTLAGIAAVNTPMGQTALSKLAFGSRPALVAAGGEGLKRLSKYAPQIIAPVAVSRQK